MFVTQKITFQSLSDCPVFILASRDTLDSSGSTVVQRITFQEFAPGLEHLDLVNSGITEIDEVCKNVIAELYH